jgi:glycosyltransferase involved in cell wall biosynthesis
MNKLHILVSAHEFSPTAGSEAGAGWNTVIQLAKYHIITVIYLQSYQQSIDEYLNEHPLPLNVAENLRFIAIKQPKITSFIVFFDKMIFGDLRVLQFLSYRFWQKKAYRYVKKTKLHKSVDAIHLVTMVNFREPGYLWKLTDNFFWGPTGGISAGLTYPFFKGLTLKYKILEICYTIYKMFKITCDRRILTAIKKSNHIYLTTPEDERFLKNKGARSVSLMNDAGTYGELIGKAREPENHQKLRIVWCGRIVERKQLNILLEAIDDAFLEQHIIVKIIGKGERKNKFQKQYARLGCLQWLEDIPRKQLFECLAGSDVLVHTSYREGATAIIPESLSVGLAVICHDAGGMSLVVTEKCGFKIPLITPEYSAKNIRRCLIKLIEDKELLLNMKKNALLRANELTWENKIKIMAENYTIVRSKS